MNPGISYIYLLYIFVHFVFSVILSLCMLLIVLWTTIINSDGRLRHFEKYYGETVRFNRVCAVIKHFVKIYTDDLNC